MRYTINDLKTMSDKDLVLSVLSERKAKCTNYYSPLYRRLTQTSYRLAREKFGHKTGADGKLY